MTKIELRLKEVMRCSPLMQEFGLEPSEALLSLHLEPFGAFRRGSRGKGAMAMALLFAFAMLLGGDIGSMNRYMISLVYICLRTLFINVYYIFYY